MQVVAASEEEGLEQVKQRYGHVSDVEINLAATRELKWKVERCDSERGAWYNDEYETIESNHEMLGPTIESNHEMLGPYDSAEEALNAVKTVWGYGGQFSLSFNSSYVSTDKTGLIDKQYTVYAVDSV